ncbi:hypothetical protein WMF27_32715 [Sorangium sp. So ce281]|uniref:hypothetical protein n=1 Tax=unclassified Sorangium TaxID=2621164 RepID=UPI003F5E3C08
MSKRKTGSENPSIETRPTLDSIQEVSPENDVGDEELDSEPEWDDNDDWDEDDLEDDWIDWDVDWDGTPYQRRDATPEEVDQFFRDEKRGRRPNGPRGALIRTDDGDAYTIEAAAEMLGWKVYKAQQWLSRQGVLRKDGKKCYVLKADLSRVAVSVVLAGKVRVDPPPDMPPSSLYSTEEGGGDELAERELSVPPPLPAPKRSSIHEGDRFGRLMVVSEAAKHPKQGRRWLCRCDCGGETEVLASNLRSGRTTSCGCRQRENRDAHYLRVLEARTTKGSAALMRLWREQRKLYSKADERQLVRTAVADAANYWRNLRRK